jgi:hypothetical protein
MKRRDLFKFLGIAAFAPLAMVKSLTPKREGMDLLQDRSPLWSADNYTRMSNAGEMGQYEGVVYGAQGHQIWRFNKVSGLQFQCHNCGCSMTFNREDFRNHGQTCHLKI